MTYQSVRADDGTRYLRLQRSSDTSLVRDPVTGEERYVENDRLEPIDDAPLAIAARGVDEDVRSLVVAVPDERTLGFLLELADHGPLGVRTILDAYEFCESDLHGRLTMLTMAGVLEQTTVAGERGYALTESGRAGLEALRGRSREP